MALEDLVKNVNTYVNSEASLQENRNFQVYKNMISEAADDELRRLLDARYTNDLMVVQGKVDSIKLKDSTKVILETMAENYSEVITGLSDGEIQERAYTLTKRDSKIETLRGSTNPERPDIAKIKKVMDEMYKKNLYYQTLSFSPEEIFKWALSKIDKDKTEYIVENFTEEKDNKKVYSPKKAYKFVQEKVGEMDEKTQGRYFMDLARSYAAKKEKK